MNANPTVATVTVTCHRQILVIRIYAALQQPTDRLRLRGRAAFHCQYPGTLKGYDEQLAA